MAQKQDDTVPGLALDDKLAAKLDGLDDQLNPIKEDLEEHGSEDEEEAGEEKPAKDEKAEEDSKDDDSEQDGKESEEDGAESEEDSDSKDEGSDSDDEGYTIDEGDEEEEEQPKTSTEEDKGSQQLTAEQKYILDNLQPITVRGTVGTETEVKEYKVYSPEYLPQGFKFVDDREMSAANKAFASLEAKAQSLQNDWRNQETQKATAEFNKREQNADRQDIANLQRAGELPRFKAAPDSPDFEKDPGVQLVQEIIDFKEGQNKKYMEEYNAGRPYKHIGFEEAFRLFQRQNPTKGNPAQAKEDTERTKIAKRTSKTSGTSTKPERQKAAVHTGMSSMDLDNLIESKTAGW